MGTNSKSRKKYNAKSALVIKELAKRYEVSDAMVRLSISGDRTSDTAEEIKKEYNRLMKEVNTALNK